MAFGNFPKEKKKLKGKKKKAENNGMFSSSAPVFVLPRIIERKKKQE